MKEDLRNLLLEQPKDIKKEELKEILKKNGYSWNEFIQFLKTLSPM